MGLPSGTLWLDRPLGANSVGDPGFMYQWGAKVGYPSLSEFAFTIEEYRAQGLNLITENLTAQDDAAAIYYGGIACMPSTQQLTELFNNTDISMSGNTYRLQSRINGNVIYIFARGQYYDNQQYNQDEIYLWAKNIVNDINALVMYIGTSLSPRISGSKRYHGSLILPVKNS